MSGIVHLANSANIKGITFKKLCNGLTGSYFESPNDTIHVTDKEQTRDIRKAFDINGIAHYMLINKNGHIVEAGSNLRPMNPVTIETIDELLTDKY